MIFKISIKTYRMKRLLVFVFVVVLLGSCDLLLSEKGPTSEIEIQRLNDELIKIKSTNKRIKDSLQEYKWRYEHTPFYSYKSNINNSNRKGKNIWVDGFLKFKKYPIPFQGQDILSWLKQFNSVSVSKVVYDYDVDPEDWKGVSSYTIKTYENGITVHEYLSYGGIGIKVEIPFITTEEAKIIFERLSLKNLAEGCLDEEDLNLEYEHNGKSFTTSVYFGNGC